MQAKDMIEGGLYRLSKDKQIVEFSRVGGTGYYIVHPPGEPDMQSSFGIKGDEECESVTQAEYKSEQPLDLLDALKECGTNRQKLIWLLEYVAEGGHYHDAAKWIKRRREISNIQATEEHFGRYLD